MTERDAELRRLGWTLAGLAAAIAPHLVHLRPWIGVFVLALGGWRVLAARRRWPLPGPWVRGAAMLATTLAVLYSYRTINGLDAGTAMLTLAAALKLLETRAPRDYVILIFLGWFLCLATLLGTQGIYAMAWVLPTVWLLAAALLHVSRSGTGGPPLAAFRTTGVMLLKAVPLAIVLFLFFPRITGHFWGVPTSERAQSGLTEEMSPGDISNLSLNDAVAFRARFDGVVPPPAQRYWRGPVLTEFDGYTWSRARAQTFLTPPVEFRGPPVDYMVTLEPTRQRMLFALDMPASWPAELGRQGWDYQLQTRNPIDAVIQYRARSYPDYRAGAELSSAYRSRHLQLPPERNLRSLALARQMRAAAADDQAYALAVLDMFNREQFFYTLTPPGLARDSVDDFLFNTRRGFCGHYASAFTTMMRAVGIPARVVGGYQGGTWNPLGGYLIVRQSDAHAWSEIWLPGRGWYRVDPTAAVAPERIEQGAEATLTEDRSLAGRFMGDSQLFWQARMAWDNANALWNDWVVRFSREHQNRLLELLGFDDPDWEALALALGVGIGIVLLLLSGWLAWEFRPPRQDAAAASYQRFVRRLRRRGLERAPWETPRVFAARVYRWRPDLAREASAITELYLRLRYLPQPGVSDLTRLRGLVGRFRP